MKPLYLKGGETRVEPDGPSLKVAKSGQADCWFPLRRVSRVISSTRVQWKLEALLACSREGITVSFLDDEGAVVARLVGRPGEREEIRQRLADFIDRPDWREAYSAWCVGMEQMAARSVARRAGFPPNDLPSPRDLRQALRRQAADHRLLTAYDQVGRQVQGLLTGYVTQRLTEAGVCPELAGWSELDLTGDLTRILFWDFRLPRLAWLAARRDRGEPLPPPEADVVIFFEARRDRSAELLRGLLNRLHHWLIEQYRWR